MTIRHGIAVIALGIALATPARSDAATCESLASTALPATTVTSAQLFPTGHFVPPTGPAPAFSQLPAFCRVLATLRPSSDSEIQIEVWLPVSGWNGKFLATGNAAYGGTIGYPALAAGIRRGYAAVATDTGHTGAGASFALGHPEKLKDFVDRAVHDMTVRGKALATAYYGSAPKYSYFNGCSTGGRQALASAQRHPTDFDGIIAGAPGNYTTRQAFGQVWIAQAMQNDSASAIPPGKLPVIHSAVLAACDNADGMRDGVLEDPTRCEFDPSTLRCEAGDSTTCLTERQVNAVRKVYAGAMHPRTGEPIFPGLERGSELGWARWAGPQPAEYATEFFKYVVFKNPEWDFKTLNFDADLALADKAAGGIDAIDPDLSPLVSRGAKLLLYAGWNDPGIAPRNAVNYYKSVVARMGEAKVRDAIRLFMVPGMGHCGGGEGTSTFDMLPALEEWVESGKPPAQIPASRMIAGKTIRTRPLCPYPQMATYKGTGDASNAENFVCK